MVDLARHHNTFGLQRLYPEAVEYLLPIFRLIKTQPVFGIVRGKYLPIVLYRVRVARSDLNGVVSGRHIISNQPSWAHHAKGE